MWSDTAIPVLRVLVNDIDGDTYDDSRLETILLASAYMIVNEIDVASTYSVDMSGETISPDPESDVGFMNLLILRTAVLIKNNEAKAAQRLGITIVDGPSTISGKEKLAAIVADAKALAAKYEKTRLEYLAGNSKAGQAIMTPFTNESIPQQDNIR